MDLLYDSIHIFFCLQKFIKIFNGIRSKVYGCGTVLPNKDFVFSKYKIFC